MDLAVLGASRELRGTSTTGCAFWGLCCTKGLDLFLAAAEAWEGLAGLGTGVVLHWRRLASQE